MSGISPALIDDENNLQHFEYIYKNYAGQMLGVASGILADCFEAEDAVQNALLGIAQSIKTAPHGNQIVLRAYVLTAARNAAFALLPAKKLRDNLIDLDSLQFSVQEDIFETVVHSQKYDLLLKIINTLPIQYREVLMLRYVIGLKPRDIAKALGRRTATIQQQLTRGKAKLAEAYQKEVSNI